MQQEYYMYYSSNFLGLLVWDYITSTKSVKLKEVAADSCTHGITIEDINRVTISSPTNADNIVEVFENPLLALKKAPKLSMIENEASTTPYLVTSSFDNYDPENEFNYASNVKKNIFQTVKLNSVLESADTPLKGAESYASRRHSVIQLINTLDSTNTQADANTYNIENGENDKVEEDANDDGAMSPDAIVEPVEIDVRRRRTAFTGYMTAFRGPTAHHVDPSVSKATTLKDSKHNAIAALTIDENEESDDALYEEFQAFKEEAHRLSEVGLGSDDGDEILFEDWKIERKQLKDGVGRQYEKAFRFFEKREQEVGIVAPKVSSSVQRAMGIHDALDHSRNPLNRKHTGKH